VCVCVCVCMCVCVCDFFTLPYFILLLVFFLVLYISFLTITLQQFFFSISFFVYPPGANKLNI